MISRSRPLLAVRLIGPAATVAREKAHLLAYLAKRYGKNATCRTSTHHAGHAGEVRAYITLTTKETT